MALNNIGCARLVAIGAAGCWLAAAALDENTMQTSRTAHAEDNGDALCSPYDARVALLGRWDLSPAEGPRAEWSGTGLQFCFEGRHAHLLIKEMPAWPSPENPQDGNYLAVSVNGSDFRTIRLLPNQNRYAVADLPVVGTHTVRVMKRTEALCGRIQLLGIELPDGGRLLPPPPPRKRRIEIIGDSVTSGYGNEASSEKDPYHPSTVNATMTFGWLAAERLQADVRMISWSGKGLYRNRHPDDRSETMALLWERTLPTDPASCNDFQSWIPDVVLILLGANDWAAGPPPQEEFIDAYKHLVRRVKSRYGNPVILCGLSATINDRWPAGMQRRTRMREWLTEIVAAWRAEGGERVFFLEFAEQDVLDGCGADYHPSARTHRKMADTLSAALAEHLGW